MLPHRCTAALFLAATLVAGISPAVVGHTFPAASSAVTANEGDEKIEPYHARFGRQRPVIAIIGQNSGTELTDYMVPFGILKQADVGDVIPVATEAGPMTMRPALRLQPQASIADFDAHYPEGADYVVVPAVSRFKDPALLEWIRQQAAKGGTLVSICDGALVLAAIGAMDGHRATAHWATASYRRKHYPAVRWTDNRRYVADRKIVSSAGISAAIPVSLALVEAIGGHDRAATTAAAIGTQNWSPRHDSQRFHPRLGRNLSAFATTNYLNPWFHKTQRLRLQVREGVDEIALAFTADTYSRTGRAQAYVAGSALSRVTTRHGLTLLPEPNAPAQAARSIDVPSGKPGLAINDVLTDIGHRYGRQTAYGVALDLEYPGFHE